MKIFYSWQSDTPLISKFLLKSIKKAIDGMDGVELYEADRNKIANIDERILDSIDNSDFFISDVSIVGEYKYINKDEDVLTRHTANPNVLYETGYAVKRFDRNRILLVASSETTRDTSFLPFDIRNRDIMIRSHSEDNVNSLAGEIKQILSGSQDPIEVEQPYILCENNGSSVSSDGVTMISYNFNNTEKIDYFLETINLNGIVATLNRNLPSGSIQAVVANGLEISPYETAFSSISFIVSRGKSRYQITQELTTLKRADKKYNLTGIIQKPAIVKL